MERIIISHISKDGRVQTNDDHQQGVAQLSLKFAAEFGMGDLGYIMGRLHDKGKEQTEWQKFIQGATGYNKEYAHIKNGPHHAYVGANIAQKQYPLIAPLIAQPIAGHHRGLYDYCDYVEETKREIPNDVTIEERIPFSMPKFGKAEKYDYHHVIRMLFSCLVDADSLDTESFMNPEQASLRGSHARMEDLLVRLKFHLQILKEQSLDTELNRIRNYVQEQCIKESRGETGFYSLTVPTGGGKTLASVLWALSHAVRHHMSRIVIAIPYTSIITQTAATLKDIFGEDNVLEHHSSFDPESIKDKKLRERMQLATENWDYPIIVTTNVQLFESLFSNKRSDCRKLHNLAKSVIVLDEVQTLPMGFYKPIVYTLDTLHRLFGASVLFTTASQPVLTGHIDGTNPSVGFDALKSVHEIIPVEWRLYDKLRRVELKFYKNSFSYDEIASEVARHQRVLCIVNTRRDARGIYERLPQDGIRLHLSRMMTPSHISATIKCIKDILKDNSDKPIRVVSTQLIEAGVDIDFPVVFRQEAGLDSILQAAGRCNREGKQGICTTYVFSLEKEHPLPTGFISQTNYARLNMGLHYDWFAPETMAEYFRQLHCRTDSFDKKQMQELLYKQEPEFEEASNEFHLIDDNTTSVFVNWSNSIHLYERLVSEGPSYSLMKDMAKYSVSLRSGDFKELLRIGAVEEPYEGIYVITNSSFYKKETGLTIENQWIEETFII